MEKIMIKKTKNILLSMLLSTILWSPTICVASESTDAPISKGPTQEEYKKQLVAATKSFMSVLEQRPQDSKVSFLDILTDAIANKTIENNSLREKLVTKLTQTFASLTGNDELTKSVKDITKIYEDALLKTQRSMMGKDSWFDAQETLKKNLIECFIEATKDFCLDQNKLKEFTILMNKVLSNTIKLFSDTKEGKEALNKLEESALQSIKNASNKAKPTIKIDASDAAQDGIKDGTDKTKTHVKTTIENTTQEATSSALSNFSKTPKGKSAIKNLAGQIFDDIAQDLPKIADHEKSTALKTTLTQSLETELTKVLTQFNKNHTSVQNLLERIPTYLGEAIIDGLKKDLPADAFDKIIDTLTTKIYSTLSNFWQKPQNAELRAKWQTLFTSIATDGLKDGIEDPKNKALVFNMAKEQTAQGMANGAAQGKQSVEQISTEFSTSMATTTGAADHALQKSSQQFATQTDDITGKVNASLTQSSEGFDKKTQAITSKRNSDLESASKNFDTTTNDSTLQAQRRMEKAAEHLVTTVKTVTAKAHTASQQQIDTSKKDLMRALEEFFYLFEQLGKAKGIAILQALSTETKKQLAEILNVEDLASGKLSTIVKTCLSDLRKEEWPKILEDIKQAIEVQNKAKVEGAQAVARVEEASAVTKGKEQVKAAQEVAAVEEAAANQKASIDKKKADELAKKAIDTTNTITTIVSKRTMMLTGGVTGTLLAGGLSYMVGSKYIKKHIYEPSLVEKQSSRSWLSAIKHWFKKPMPIIITDHMIFSESSAKELEHTALMAEKVRANNGFFEHVLLYGAPGTGKTLYARLLAESCGMDYYFVPAARVSQYLTDGTVVEKLTELFSYAASSKKGAIICFDEAEVFLSQRSRMTNMERNALSAFLTQTGEPSNKIMIVCTTNNPEVLDNAVLDRFGIQIKFDLPDVTARKKQLEMHIKSIFKTNNKNAALKYTLLDDATYVDELARRTDGYSGRMIQKLVNRIHQSTLITPECEVTTDIVDMITAQINRHIKEA